MNIIYAYEQLGKVERLSGEEGNLLYTIMKPLIESGEDVEVSFRRVKDFNFAFVNNSISRLIVEVGSDKVFSSVRLIDIPNTPLVDVLKDSISIAKHQERKGLNNYE